jgi:A/G-specific adenine glycosylase
VPPRPPFAADWREIGVVRHTFTHFHLILRVQAARVPAETGRHPGEWRPAGPLAAALPSVMRKALGLGLASIDAVAGRV